MKTKNILLLLIFSLSISVSAQEEYNDDNSSDMVYKQYEQAFLSQNIEKIIELYAQDAIIVVSPGGNTFKGKKDIRAAYAQAFSYYPDSLSFKTFEYTTEDNLVHHTFSILNKVSGEELIPFSTETILITGGKIKYHTVAEYYPDMNIEPPFPLSVPKDWNSQTSALPRYFAPNLYEGVADYAFAPGMFQPNKKDHFTYAMVLWVPIGTNVNREELEEDLEIYFDGLAAVGMPEINSNNAETKVNQLFDSLATQHAVAEDDLRASVKLTPFTGEDEQWNKIYAGTMNIYEGMAAHERIKLNIRVRLQKCPYAGHQVIFLQASRQPYSHDLWKPLNEMARQWQCPEE